MKKYVIIVAGGSGSRMNANIPKQFIPIAGKPILMHTIFAFHDYLPQIKIVLVLPKIHISSWNKLCDEYNFSIQHEIIEGGKTRFHSVKNGLERIPKDCIVAIHDGARPLVSKSSISNSFNAAEIFGNAVPVIPINESVREIDKNHNKFVDRKKLRIVQTPQCFKSSIIKKAYEQDYNESFNDDASIAETVGEKIHLVDGNSENIKVTYPSDIKIANALLKKTL